MLDSDLELIKFKKSINAYQKDESVEYQVKRYTFPS